jgi:hypothetical protein
MYLSFNIGHSVGAASLFASWNKNEDDVITKDEVKIEQYIIVCKQKY